MEKTTQDLKKQVLENSKQMRNLSNPFLPFQNRQIDIEWISTNSQNTHLDCQNRPMAKKTISKQENKELSNEALVSTHDF